jgi:hypothetical protein
VQEAGIDAMTVAAYAKLRSDCPELQDLVAAGAEREQEASGGDAVRPSGRPDKRPRIYQDHKTATDIAAGIKAGKYHQVWWL